MNANHQGRTGLRQAGFIAAVLFAIATIWTISAGTASAHASLISAEPADNSVVAGPLQRFALTFSEPVSPLVLRLVQPDGKALPLDRFVLRDATLDIEAPGNLAHGTYVLSWRVISEDGHPVGGAVIFSIGAPSTGAPPEVIAPVDWSVRIAIWIAKWALYAALFVGIGGAFFQGWIDGRSTAAPRIAIAVMILGLFAAPLSVGLQGLDALEASFAHLTERVIWQTGFDTSYGRTAIIAMGALAAGLVSSVLKGSARRALSLIALVAVGLALAASGHASAAQPQWLTRPAVFLHGAGIGFWAGSLLPLGRALASPTPEAVSILHRFSKVIPFAVLLLAAAGIALAVIQLGSAEALWITAYGKVFLVKLALLAALFWLAFDNRFRLTKPVMTDDADSARRLRRSIVIEIALVLAIFAVAALWRFTPPPRTLAEATATQASVHIHTDKVMAEITITPGHVGLARASIDLLTGDFGTLDAKAVTLVLSNPAAGIEPIKRPAFKPGDGTWRVDDLNLPVPGLWTARIEVLISDFELVEGEGTIDIRR